MIPDTHDAKIQNVVALPFIYGVECIPSWGCNLSLGMWSLSGDVIPHCSRQLHLSSSLPVSPSLRSFKTTGFFIACVFIAGFFMQPHWSGKRHPWNIFWPGDLDLWPMTLTYELDLDILPLDLHTKDQVWMFVRSTVRVFTDRQTDRQTHRRCQNYYTRHWSLV